MERGEQDWDASWDAYRTRKVKFNVKIRPIQLQASCGDGNLSSRRHQVVIVIEYVEAEAAESWHGKWKGDGDGKRMNGGDVDDRAPVPGLVRLSSLLNPALEESSSSSSRNSL